MAQLRRDLLAGIAGDIIEVGAGNGMNFSHYPVGAATILAVEPEPYLRRQAAQAAGSVDVPVAVVPGRAERLPADDASKDAGVVSLMLCALRDQDLALRELHRVIRPGGKLRFLEHVEADDKALRLVQRIADATLWPMLTGGCRTARDPLTSIVHAGFELQQVRRVPFPETILPVPSSPHALGVAIRR